MTEAIALWIDTRHCSPWVAVVWACLGEKDIPFTPQAVNLQKGEHRQGSLAEASLNGKVPTIRHGDFWLSESQAIIEYLEDAFPAPRHRPLLPHSAQDRARDRAVMAWLRSDFLEMRRVMSYEGIMLGLPTPAMTAEAETEAVRLVACANQRWRNVAPDAPPMAVDLDLAIALRRPLHFAPRLLDQAPAVRARAESLWGRPAVQSWVEAPREP